MKMMTFLTTCYVYLSLMGAVPASFADTEMSPEEWNTKRSKDFVSSTLATGLDLTPWVSVEGWPGGVCADFRTGENSGKKSVWVWRLIFKPTAWQEGEYNGSCGSWERTTTRTPYQLTKWPGLVCSDYKQDHSISRWYRLVNGIGSAVDMDRNCTDRSREIQDLHFQ